MMPDADPVGILCELAEACAEEFEAHALRCRYGDALAFLIRIGALSPGNPLKSISCQECDVDHSALVEFDPAASRSFYFCPEAGRVMVDDADLATLRLDPEWLVEWLTHEIPVITPKRRRMLVPRRVWYLGGAMIGNTSFSVIFARNISSQTDLETLADVLSLIRAEDLGIVVTTSPTMPGALLQTRRYFPLDLREILRADPERLVLDYLRLGAWIKGFRQGVSRPLQDGPGRPSDKDLVLQIYRERAAKNGVPPSMAAEARAIQAEFRLRRPDSKPPALKTIQRHLQNATL